MVLKRIGPVSLAKILGLLYAAGGLIVGAILSAAALAGLLVGDSSEGSRMFAFFGAAAVVVLPLFYGTIGFVGALVGAWVFNVVAGVVGGVELELL